MPTIIYEKQKVIYCAIEKCAITRLISYFGTIYKQETKRGYPPDLAEQIFFPAKEIFKSNYPISYAKKKYPDYFIFSFVRNPFDRVVSNYHFNLGPWIRRHKKGEFEKVPTFEEYCLNMEKWNNLQPLSFYVDIDIDFIGKVENFKQDFDRLHKILKIDIAYNEGNHPLNRIENRSGRKEKKYQNFYSKESRAAIEEKYAEDLERFKYKF